MNLLMTGLIGYALKEVVVPLITGESDESDNSNQQVSDKEVDNALFESNDLVKLVSNIVDIVV
ncbi:flagellar hook protein [Photobacterium damselae]|uniref:flagellar hook protein n=1 Tax=Photobacterium damselae TaxID=38293 RepID=UPI002341D554|nr:flagellar hook protein [Photobacterium damselae]MDC4168785.1 flagellar hook protein [Photobacterium damselae]